MIICVNYNAFQLISSALKKMIEKAQLMNKVWLKTPEGPDLCMWNLAERYTEVLMWGCEWQLERRERKYSEIEFKDI